MSVDLISQKGSELTFQVKINITGSMLEMEERILEASNALGSQASESALKRFDTDGSPIVVGGIKFTSKVEDNKVYQTPYGPIKIKRHVYQSSRGGKTFCPLEPAARIINGATPRFAKMLSNKYGRMSAPEVVADLNDNHGRHVTLRYLQNVSATVATIVELKEEKWDYQTPVLEEAIETVGISMDGAYVLMHEVGYREAMVGSVSLYDCNGDRQHTIYIGSTPEYGKAHFKERMEQEIEHVKKHYPKANYLGIADGARDNWSFLKEHTDKQLIDFYHATEYLAKVAEAAYPEKTSKPEKKAWLEERCHQLKHEPGAALFLLEEMKKLKRKKKLRREVRENLDAALTYFTNNYAMMNYHEHVKEKLPIGSGVTEAACKTLIKQRFCKSGMRWKDTGMRVVLSLRQLIQTGTRWKQFWDKVNHYGVPALR